MHVADSAVDRIVEQVRDAAHSRTPLQICGHGSKAFYGNAQAATPLSTEGLRGITAYEPSELVVSVRAGTPLLELEAALAEQGQWLACEPPRLGATPDRSGTVGGMVASALSGPGRAHAGSVRDFVLGCTVINGQAQVLNFGGQVMKNVAGYDVSRLMAGSLGILGVLSDVSLKVLPQPVATATVRMSATQAEALERMNAWGSKPWPISASAWWDGTLVVRLSGAQAAVQDARGRLGSEVVDPPLAHAFWQGLRDQRDEYFVTAQARLQQGERLWRLSVPSTCGVLDLPGDTLIEWGGAQRWLCSDAPVQRVHDAAHAAGGHACVFRGAAPADGVFAPLSTALHTIHRQLKAAFDPQGIFNPGRLYLDL